LSLCSQLELRQKLTIPPPPLSLSPLTERGFARLPGNKMPGAVSIYASLCFTPTHPCTFRFSLRGPSDLLPSYRRLSSERHAFRSFRIPPGRSLAPPPLPLAPSMHLQEAPQIFSILRHSDQCFDPRTFLCFLFVARTDVIQRLSPQRLFVSCSIV